MKCPTIPSSSILCMCLKLNLQNMNTIKTIFEMFSVIVKVKAARLIQNEQEYDVNALTDVRQLVVCQDLM